MASSTQAEGAYTKMGTWAPTQTDAEVIEMMADKDEEWEKSLKGKSEWINRPAQPPGLLRTGTDTCVITLETMLAHEISSGLMSCSSIASVAA